METEGGLIEDNYLYLLFQIIRILKKTYIRYILFCLFLLLFCNYLKAQEVPFSVNNYGTYEFLDELANSQIISVNSAVKP